MAIKVGQGVKNVAPLMGPLGGVPAAAEGISEGKYDKAAGALGTAGLSETSVGKQVVNKVKGATSGPKAFKTAAPGQVDTGVIDVRNIDPNDPRLSFQAAQIGQLPGMERTQIGAVTPAQAAQIQAGGNFNQAMAAQSGLLGQLQAQASGQAPSIADMQMQKGMEANLAATRASLASARGGTNPLLARQTMQTSADIQAKTAQDAAMAKLQEQMAAQNQLATVSGQARVQSFEEAAQQAQLQQQANLANMQSNLQRAIAQGQLTAQEASQIYQSETQKAMQNAQYQQQANMGNANNFLQAMQMGVNRDLGVSGQSLGAQQFDISQASAANQFNSKAAADARNFEMQRNMAILQGASQVGGFISGLPSGTFTGGPAAASTSNVQGANSVASAPMSSTPSNATTPQNYVQPNAQNPGQDPNRFDYLGNPVASDVNLKTDIRDASKDIQDFLSTMGAHNYRYTDEKHGEGRFVSPMAQELEASKLGKSLVVNTAEGKKVDYQRGYGFLMAAASYLNNRLDTIEKKKK